jgi:hypothetical protein
VAMLVVEMTWPANFDVPTFFVRTELELGLTFALIAAHASNEEKFQRNRNNARRACGTARRFLGRITVPEDNTAELQEMLDELERRLRVLDGFTFPRPGGGAKSYSTQTDLNPRMEDTSASRRA